MCWKRFCTSSEAALSNESGSSWGLEARNTHTTILSNLGSKSGELSSSWITYLSQKCPDICSEFALEVLLQLRGRSSQPQWQQIEARDQKAQNTIIILGHLGSGQNGCGKRQQQFDAEESLLALLRFRRSTIISWGFFLSRAMVGTPGLQNKQ